MSGEKRWNLVLSGYLGTGKTMLAERLVADYPNFARIGVDELRKMLFNEAYPTRDEFLVYSMIADVRDDLLGRGYSVVVDSTAPDNVTREFLLENKAKSVNRLLIVFNVERNVLIKRSKKKFGNAEPVFAYDTRWEEPRGNIPVFKFRSNILEEFYSYYALLTELLESETHPYKPEFYTLSPLKEVRKALKRFIKKTISV